MLLPDWAGAFTNSQSPMNAGYGGGDGATRPPPTSESRDNLGPAVYGWRAFVHFPMKPWIPAGTSLISKSQRRAHPGGGTSAENAARTSLHRHLKLTTRSGLEYWPAQKVRFVRMQGTAAALGLLSSASPHPKLFSSEEFHTSRRHHPE